LPTFHDDAGQADNVVLVRRQFADEALTRGKVEDGARSRDVLLEKHQAPAAVEHAQGERPLLARDLVVIELHRIDAAAAVLIVLREGFEYRGEKNAGARSLRVWLHCDEDHSGARPRRL
jgi:hypothetical protein